MPAAAVIPAPVAYIKVVAVKKLVVGFLAVIDEPWSSGSRFEGLAFLVANVSGSSRASAW